MGLNALCGRRKSARPVAVDCHGWCHVYVCKPEAQSIGRHFGDDRLFFFSVNDGAIKFLSGGYALHEVVLIRSVIGLVILLVLIAPLTDGFAIFRTKRLGMHLIRGFCVVMANMTFFLGLAAMPLADAVAIFFISPLIITVFSVVFLGEYVGPRRWAAVIVGLIGVVIMMRPGTASFQYASLLPVVAATAYAGLHMLTRLIGRALRVRRQWQFTSRLCLSRSV